MSTISQSERDVYQSKTRFALLLSHVLSEPLFYMNGLLIFVMRKELDASMLQISLLTSLRPIVAILAFYWSSFLRGRRYKLRTNFRYAGLLGRVPFLFFPFVDNIWYFVLSGAVYMLFYRAANPAWMEILKINLPSRERERTYSLGTALGFAEGVILALGCGYFLDHTMVMWKWLFLISALVGIVGIVIQSRVPIRGDEVVDAHTPLTWKEGLLKPWQNSLNLMKTRPDFARFQWGFMLGGLGLMILQPALPLFFVDVLKLSYLDISIALMICKGLGSSLSSPIWGRLMGRLNVNQMMALMLLLFGLFPLALFIAKFQLSWFYAAYVIYGCATAGSHLLWNLSGPMFAKDEDSSLFSGVNVAMIGIRGSVGPTLGAYLCAFFGPIGAFVFAIFLCFFAAQRLLMSKKVLSVR